MRSLEILTELKKERYKFVLPFCAVTLLISLFRPKYLYTSVRYFFRKKYSVYNLLKIKHINTFY